MGSCIVPANAVCDKGTSTWVMGLGCQTPGEGRRRSCADDCTWGTWGPCEVQYPAIDGSTPVNADIVISAIGQVVSATRTLSAGSTIARVPSSFAAVTCPIAASTSFSSSVTPFVYTTIGNSTPAPRTVAIWASMAPGGSNIDTVMATYPFAPGPMLEADRRNCIGVTNDDCGTNTVGCDTASGFSGLVEGDAITIPPGQTFTVIVQSYFSTDTGSFVLNAKATN